MTPDQDMGSALATFTILLGFIAAWLLAQRNGLKP